MIRNIFTDGHVPTDISEPIIADYYVRHEEIPDEPAPEGHLWTITRKFYRPFDVRDAYGLPIALWVRQ